MLTTLLGWLHWRRRKNARKAARVAAREAARQAEAEKRDRDNYLMDQYDELRRREKESFDRRRREEIEIFDRRRREGTPRNSSELDPDFRKFGRPPIPMTPNFEDDEISDSDSKSIEKNLRIAEWAKKSASALELHRHLTQSSTRHLQVGRRGAHTTDSVLLPSEVSAGYAPSSAFWRSPDDGPDDSVSQVAEAMRLAERFRSPDYSASELSAARSLVQRSRPADPTASVLSHQRAQSELVPITLDIHSIDYQSRSATEIDSRPQTEIIDVADSPTAARRRRPREGPESTASDRIKNLALTILRGIPEDDDIDAHELRDLPSPRQHTTEQTASSTGKGKRRVLDVSIGDEDDNTSRTSISASAFDFPPSTAFGSNDMTDLSFDPWRDDVKKNMEERKRKQGRK